jgi:cell wall-associated NlpC family hydrolase
MTAPTILQIVPTITDQKGDRYVLGAEARFSDRDPKTFDCSELFEWAVAGRWGVPFPDGAANQWRFCQQHKTTLGVAEGIATFGTLLFRVVPHGGGGGGDHVAMSLGNGQTFEARGRKYGVNYFTAGKRVWTGAARIPGVTYATGTTPIQPPIVKEGRVATAADVNQNGALGRLERLFYDIHTAAEAHGIKVPLVDKPQPKDATDVLQVNEAAIARLDLERDAILAAVKALAAKH